MTQFLKIFTGLATALTASLALANDMRWNNMNVQSADECAMAIELAMLQEGWLDSKSNDPGQDELSDATSDGDFIRDRQRAVRNFMFAERFVNFCVGSSDGVAYKSSDNTYRTEHAVCQNRKIAYYDSMITFLARGESHDYESAQIYIKEQLNPCGVIIQRDINVIDDLIWTDGIPPIN